MAIRAALNAARWLLPLALVAIIKMHYNPHSLASISSFPFFSNVFSLPSCNRFFSFGRRASHLFLFSCFRFFFGEPTVPSAIYSLCRGELHPYSCISLSSFLPPSLPRSPDIFRSSCTLEDTFNLSSPPLKSTELFTDAPMPVPTRSKTSFDIWLTFRQARTCTKYTDVEINPFFQAATRNLKILWFFS